MLEQKASRMASSLGVGKLSDDKMYPAIFGFVKEGIRYAFSSSEPGTGEEFHVGSRLPFLRVVNKYVILTRVVTCRDTVDLGIFTVFFCLSR
jgi:cohesin complex subunit SA-1/2